MKYNELFREDNEAIRERYELATERIALMEQEDSVREPYRAFFHKAASLVLMVKRVAELALVDKLTELSYKEQEGLNRALYEDIVGENYYYSYANPSFAAEKLGLKFGKLLSYLMTELRSIIIYAYECRLYEITIFLELLIEVYNYFEAEDDYTYKDVKRAIYNFMSDYCEVLVEYRVRELVDPELSFARDIIMDSDLTDLRYLYQYGE